VTAEIHLHEVGAETLQALYDDRPDWWTHETGLSPTAWPRDDRRMLGYRMAALRKDPGAAPYLLHLVLDEDGAMLGRIGCHEGPDDEGAVEIGYYVRPEARQAGVAGTAVGLFLGWLRDRGVRAVRASVGPTNEASLRILHRHGFVETGRQIDDEDGEEIGYLLIL
jgi:RimJ/RimL family protein N-acetyltransferase